MPVSATVTTAALRRRIYEEMHAAAGDIVLDGIVAEVVEDLIQKPPHALRWSVCLRLPPDQRDRFLGGCRPSGGL